MKETVYVVLQSQERHDAYDNFGDFMLGVELGALGFVHAHDVEFGDAELEALGEEYGENYSESFSAFSTRALSEEERGELDSVLKGIWLDSDLRAERILDAKNAQFKCFSWYEDALFAVAADGGKRLNLFG